MVITVAGLLYCYSSNSFYSRACTEVEEPGIRFLMSLLLQNPVDFDQLEEAVKSLNKELMRENRHLQDLTTQLQEKHHKISLEVYFLLSFVFCELTVMD